MGIKGILLSIIITSLGVFFWLWSRGGKWRVVRPRELDEMEQTFYTPLVAPFLWLISVMLTIYGLFMAYKSGWTALFLVFILAINLGLIIFKILNKLFLHFED